MSTRYRLGRLVCVRVLLITAVPGAPGSLRRLRSSPASRGTLRTVPKVAFAVLIIKLIAVFWFYGRRNDLVTSTIIISPATTCQGNRASECADVPVPGIVELFLIFNHL